MCEPKLTHSLQMVALQVRQYRESLSRGWAAQPTLLLLAPPVGWRVKVEEDVSLLATKSSALSGAEEEAEGEGVFEAVVVLGMWWPSWSKCLLRGATSWAAVLRAWRCARASETQR